MAIDYRHSCDKCGKSLIDDGTEIYCAECFRFLEDELGEAKNRIGELENELERRENESSRD